MTRRIMTIIASVLLAPMLLCTAATDCTYDTCSELKWGYTFGTFDGYSMSSSLQTPKGILYDPSGLLISPELIDRLTDEVEQCLNMTIDRHSFMVKIASDWVYSCDMTEQLLPTLAGSAGCIAKGLTPTDTCPCRFRAGIKCPDVLIATPSLYLYKDVLVRFITGNANPWSTPHLATCASPSTTPLNDGSDPKNGL